MKKTSLMLIMILVSLLLFACGDPYDISHFDEGDIIDISSEDLKAIFDELDLEQTNGANSLDFTFNMNSETNQNTFYGNDYKQTIDFSMNAFIYMTESDSLNDIQLSATANSSYHRVFYQIFTMSNNMVKEEDVMMKVAFDTYLDDGYVFLNRNVEYEDLMEYKEWEDKNHEVIFNGLGKEKTSLSNLNLDDLLDTSDLTDIDIDFSSELLDLFSLENFFEMLDVFPIMTVYQRRGITDVRLEINKGLLRIHLEDLLQFIYDKRAENEEDVGSEEEVSAEIDSIISDYRESIADIDNFNITVDVVMDQEEIVRVVSTIDIRMFSSTSSTTQTVDLNFSFDMRFNVDMPELPDDLDTYITDESIDLEDFIIIFIGLQGNW